jgi:hypothetical protein
MMKYRKRWVPHVRETRQQRRGCICCRRIAKKEREGGNKRSSSQYTYYTATYTAKPTGIEGKEKFILFCLVRLSITRTTTTFWLVSSIYSSFISCLRLFFSAVVRIAQYLGYPRVPFLFFFLLSILHHIVGTSVEYYLVDIDECKKNKFASAVA